MSMAVDTLSLFQMKNLKSSTHLEEDTNTENNRARYSLVVRALLRSISILCFSFCHSYFETR